MSSALRAAADVGLRRQRAWAAGRFTPDTHRSYSEAGSWVAGIPVVGKLFTSKPGAGDGVADMVTSRLAGTSLDPATLMGFPVDVPADWAAVADGPTKYAFYVEGVDAGFVRGGFLGILVGALAATTTHFVIMRLRKR
jgi:hypothetical protein